jgi:TonB family protein
VFQSSEPFKLSPRSLAASLFLHASAITLLCVLGFPGSTLRTHKLRAVLLVPALERPVVRAHSLPQPPLKKFIAPPQRAVEAPKLIPPALEPPPLRLPDPAPLPAVPAPPPIAAAQLSPSAAPVPVKLGSFDQPKPAPPIVVPKAELKPAGFAAAEAPAVSQRQRGIATGSFATAAAGSSFNPARHGGLAQAWGFGDTQASSGSGAVRPSVTVANFGNTTVAGPTRQSQTVTASPLTPVEILDKPRPAYTEEARRLNIQGEVLLEVGFTASGQARVLRLIRGLGHGLDETAAAAASQIHFRPALRNGTPVDSTAVVHIVFQLAY